MTFAAPFMLWSLLALLPLLAVYLLKVRPRKRPTTAYFLWEKIFHERKANRLWHRLRSLWSLLLMAAAFAAIALALAEPRWSDDRRQDLLILIDNSASMGTKEGGSDRLELAKEKARDLARALDGVQRAAVATVADRLRYQSHLTDNPRELLAAIDKIEPTYESFRVAALPAGPRNAKPENAETPDQRKTEANGDETPPDNAGASSEPTENRGPAEAEPEQSDPEPDWSDQRRVLLVTDGVLGGADPPEDIELILVGEKQANVGIVAVDLQFVPGSPDRMSFYYQIASTFEEPTEVDLVLSREDETGDRQLAKVIPLTVEPGVNKPQTLTVQGAEPGRWVAELDIQDALAADNTAWVVGRRPPPIAMQVASEDAYFLQASVQAFDLGSSALRLVDANPEVVLGKGATDGKRVILFQPQGESPWWSDLQEPAEGEQLEVGAVKVLVADHPVVRHVDPFSISFLGARRLQAPPGSQVLVEAVDGTPLIYTAKRSGDSAVVVNLDPVDAEFYFSAWFPVLVHSAAKHLAGREDQLLAVYRPGDSPDIPHTKETFTGEFLSPGQEDPVAIDSPRLSRLETPGFYEVTSGEQSWTVGCSLLAERETLNANEKEVPPPAALATGGPPGGWFIVLALIVATTESVLYHLRKVG